MWEAIKVTASIVFLIVVAACVTFAIVHAYHGQSRCDEKHGNVVRTQTFRGVCVVDGKIVDSY